MRIKKLMKSHTLKQNPKKISQHAWWPKFILAFALAFVVAPLSFAKEHYLGRKFLNQFHLNLAIGYGINFYENSIFGMYMYEQDGNHYLTLPVANDNYIKYLVKGISQPYIRLKTHEPITLKDHPNKFIKFKGQGAVLPLSLSVHIDILRKLRIELGTSLLINNVSILRFNKKNEHLGELQDALGRYYRIRYFARLGFKLYENQAYTVLFNTQDSYDVGYSSLGDSIPIYQSFFATIGLGLTLEKHISPYCTTFACCMYEFGNCLNSLVPDRSFGLLNQQGIYLQLGMHINFPEIPKCPLPYCKIVTNHKHDDKPYRGQSILQRAQQSN
jgi:hypothetical protein